MAMIIKSGLLYPSGGTVPTPYGLEDLQMNPSGNTYRGIGGDWFNAENIAKEDWTRSEVSANNAWIRDMVMNEYNNNFNAYEAQKQRAWAERMTKSQYQMAVDDMKKAGLNPILAYSQGSSGIPTGNAAVSSVSRSSPANRGSGVRANTADFIKSVLGVVTSLVSGYTGIANLGVKAGTLALNRDYFNYYTKK